MKVSFDRPSAIDGFWSWVHHTWHIHTPTGRWRYQTETGSRWFGVTVVTVETDKHGSVL